MLRRLKKEFFYICRLFRQPYSWRFYFAYFKYRFFSGRILSALPKITCQAEADLELHYICQKQDLEMLEWSLRSFLFFSQLCPKIIIHDDGSIDRLSARKFEGNFSNLKVLLRAEADRQIYQSPHIPEIIKGARKRGHPVLSQLTDTFLLSESPLIMLMDSDVLFFNKPTEILDFIHGPNHSLDALISRQYGTYDLMMNKYYLNKYDLIGKEVGYMNPGFIIYKKTALSSEQLAEYFENTSRDPYDFFMPMTGWGCLIAQTNFKFLPPEKYIIKGRPDKQTVMKHFTGPRRYDFFAYGIDSAKIGKKNYGD